MSLCIRGCGFVDADTPEDKRLHLLKHHPEAALESGHRWTPADLPDPLVAEKIHVIEPDGCWQWTAALTPNGYGHFFRRRPGKARKTYVHRYVHAQLVGEIPEGHDVHHSCHNRWCCSPYHIAAVPHSVNAGPGQRQFTKGTALCL